MKIDTILKLIIAIVVAELVGVVGAMFTAPAIAGWYAGIIKPALNPPAWVFGPVWSSLYLLMGISFWLIWKSDSREKKRAMLLFLIQLALNAIWSPIFFGAHSIGGALAVIVLLWAAIVLTILVFRKISKPAAWLLVPYILWVTFAIYLNYSIATSTMHAVIPPHPTWTTHTVQLKTGETFQISYPPDFTASETSGKIILEHSWPLHHQDPCDFKGDAPVLEKLTDFSATFELVKSPMRDVVKSNETPELIKEDFQNGKFQLSTGFIDEYTAGNLHGYQITSGVEGCGRWRYYFPLDANTTLVVNRDFGEFLSLTDLQATYGTNPAAILPNVADNIFKDILKSFIDSVHE